MKSSRRRGRLALLLALSSTPIALFASDEPPFVPRVTSSAELTLTNLDVVVTDKKGQHVQGLLPADFEVVQDGRPMKISNFQEVRATSVQIPAAAPEAPGETVESAVESAPPLPAVAVPRPPRTVVVFVDRLRMPDGDERRKFFASVGSLMRRAMTPGDRAMIMSWDRTVQSVTPFTDDFAILEESLRRLEKASGGVPLEGAIQDQISQEAAWFAGTDAAIGGAASSGSSMTQRLYAARAYYEMQRKTAVLRGLVASLAGIEGKKVLILAAHRFSRYAGLEFFLSKRAGIGDASMGDSREYDSKGLLESVALAANASGVTFYGLFPAGRGWESSVSAADRERPGFQSGMIGGREDLVVNNEAEALELVADRTGGLVALGTKEIETTLARAAEDLESYYSIAYEAPFRRPDRPASISVKVRGRKDLVVRARQEVVEKNDDGRMKDRVLSNLFVPDSRSKLAVSVLAQPADRKASRKRIAVQIQIPIKDLVTIPDRKGESGAFSVFVASAGPEGQLSEVRQQRKTFQIASTDLPKARGSFYTYEMTVETNGPGSILSIGVLDELGKEAGFGRVAITAPTDDARAREKEPPVRPTPFPDPFPRRGARSRFGP